MAYHLLTLTIYRGVFTPKNDAQTAHNNKQLAQEVAEQNNEEKLEKRKRPGPTTWGWSRLQTSERMPQKNISLDRAVTRGETQRQTNEKLKKKEKSRLSRTKQDIQTKANQQGLARSIIIQILTNAKENKVR